jgi:hypothetical protein
MPPATCLGSALGETDAYDRSYHHLSPSANPEQLGRRVLLAASRAAGVYTVWEGHRLRYVGMSGQAMTAEDLEPAAAVGS